MEARDRRVLRDKRLCLTPSHLPRRLIPTSSLLVSDRFAAATVQGSPSITGSRSPRSLLRNDEKLGPLSISDDEERGNQKNGHCDVDKGTSHADSIGQPSQHGRHPGHDDGAKLDLDG